MLHNSCSCYIRRILLRWPLFDYLSIAENWDLKPRPSGAFPCLKCSAAQCGKARKTWDDDHRRVQFGGAEPALKATTENGPISIESSKGDDV